MSRHIEPCTAQPQHADPAVRAPRDTSEMLLLPDGKLLVHNLTPKMARLLRSLNPADPQIAPRSLPVTERTTRNTNHSP